MDNPIFKLTDDGYGIHTFEIKIIALDPDEYKLLKNRLFEKGAMYDRNRKNVIIAKTEKYSGIRIKLHKNFVSYLEVIINPWTLLNHQNAPLRIMSAKENDPAKLKAELNKQLSFYLGDEFGLERFQLTRIDCTATFMFADPSMTAKYLDLIKRSIKIGKGSVIKCWNATSEEDVRNQMAHSFQVNFYETKFTAYDKLYEIQRRDKDFSIESGLLRIELALNNIKINAISKELNIRDIIDQVTFFCDNSETLMRKFINFRFPYGDYYSCESAKRIIDASDLQKKSRNNILEHLWRHCLYDDYDSYNRETKRRLKTEMRYRTLKNNLRDYGINFIPIPKWDKSVERLPGMYSLFGITEEEYEDE